MLVYVINRHGKPLMPCSPRKARLLLKGKKAVPFKGKTGHFTIQLLYGSSGYKQEIVLGIDTGVKRVPIAVFTNGKIVYAKEKILRTDVKKRLLDRRQYRRTRRSRKTRYRKPRFLNRTKTKCARCGVNNVPKSWGTKKRRDGKSLKTVSLGRKSLCRQCEGKKGIHNNPIILPPSIRNRAKSIMNDVMKLSRSLPISRVIVEIASFDTQKMANIMVEGVEYQQGTLFGYEIKQYLLTVHRHKCAYCKGLSGDPILNIEHIHPKGKGGTDKITNLTIACRRCNEDKGSLTLEQWEPILRQSSVEIDKRRIKNLSSIKKQRDLKKGFQYSALTQSYKNYLMLILKSVFDVRITYGAKTKFDRVLLGLPKSQIHDAIVIASEGKEVELPDEYILEKQLKKRRPAQFISPPKKGVRITKRKWNSELYGFRLWDKIEIDGQVGYVGALRASGSFRIHDLESSQIFGGKSHKKLELLQACRSNYVREIRSINSSVIVKGEPEQLLLSLF